MSKNTWMLISILLLAFVFPHLVSSQQAVVRWTDAVLKETHGPVSMFFSPDGKYLASTAIGAGYLWDTSNGRLVRRVTDGAGTASTPLAFSPDSKHLLNSSFLILEVATGKEIRRLGDPGNGGEASPFCEIPVNTFTISNGAFSPDGQIVAAFVGYSIRVNHIHFWNANTGKSLHETDGFIGLSELAFSPDGKTIVAVDEDGGIRLFEVKTGKLLRSFHHGEWSNPAVYSPDSFLIASCGQIWDTNSGELKKKLIDHKGDIIALAFSPDSKQLAGVRFEGALAVWDINTGKLLKDIRLPGGALFCASFSPDFKVIATSAHADCSIRLWDVSTGKEITPVDPPK